MALPTYFFPSFFLLTVEEIGYPKATHHSMPPGQTAPRNCYYQGRGCVERENFGHDVDPEELPSWFRIEHGPTFPGRQLPDFGREPGGRHPPVQCALWQESRGHHVQRVCVYQPQLCTRSQRSADGLGWRDPGMMSSVVWLMFFCLLINNISCIPPRRPSRPCPQSSSLLPSFLLFSSIFAIFPIFA